MTEDERPQYRRHSRVELYVHIVWATCDRQAWLTPEWERRVHRCIISQAREMRCAIIAIGGMPDHVHVLVGQPATLGVSALVQRVKGASSRLMNAHRVPDELPFRWQDGYACFSIGRSQVRQVAAYVNDQKRHHKSDSLWSQWEETDEDEGIAARATD